MRLIVLLFCATSIVCVVLSYGVSEERKELGTRDLLAEYEKLVPINNALHHGDSDVLKNVTYPRVLGTFNSREVTEVYWCGDVCPQYGSVNILYSQVKEDDCAPIGQSVYSFSWGKQYRGCTPLISRDGSLVEKGFSSWSIAYHPDGSPIKLVVQDLCSLTTPVFAAKVRSRLLVISYVKGKGYL